MFDRPHTLSADELYLAHLLPTLQSAEEALVAKLETTQTRNLEFGATIRRQREEIDLLMRGVEDSVRDLQGAVEAMEEGNNGEGLRMEMLEMEQELRV